MGGNKVRPIDGHDGDSHITYIVTDELQAAKVRLPQEWTKFHDN